MQAFPPQYANGGYAMASSVPPTGYVGGGWAPPMQQQYPQYPHQQQQPCWSALVTGLCVFVVMLVVMFVVVMVVRSDCEDRTSERIDRRSLPSPQPLVQSGYHQQQQLLHTQPGLFVQQQQGPPSRAASAPNMPQPDPRTNPPPPRQTLQQLSAAHNSQVASGDFIQLDGEVVDENVLIDARAREGVRGAYI